MPKTSRPLRVLALVFAALLIAVGSATPVQAASKRERYYAFMEGFMRETAELAAADAGYSLTPTHLGVLYSVANHPDMFSVANSVCRIMRAAKTAPARKRARRAFVKGLSERIGELLLEVEQMDEPNFSEIDKYFTASVVSLLPAGALAGAGVVVCPDQASHIKPMVIAYLKAVKPPSFGT
jgi:hypothetical protein